MTNKELTVISNRKLNDCTYELILGGDNLLHVSGSFMEIELDNCFLKRPFSIADSSNKTLTLLYKVVGVGTKTLTKAITGDKFNCLLNLGKGFSINNIKKPLLIGGGIGAAPLYQLAKDFVAKNIPVEIILGFRNKEEIYYLDEFSKLGNVTVATDDGSFGYHGNILGLLKSRNYDFDRYYACGPTPMLIALQAYSTDGQLSLEARMGCGFGVCMGCSIKTTNGFKRVCKEGPVFDAKEVLW